MTDPLSIAASALAVAGAGGKLAQTLYIFIESVRKSEKQLKPVADHVKLTSVVLNHIGSLLGQKDVRDLCKDGLIGTTSDALEGCRQAFDDLRDYVDNFLKPDSNGKARMKTFDKLTFLPFRQRELDVLQTNLERFKSALDLVLSVLNLSISIKNNKDASQIQQLKLQVENLLKAKNDAEEAVRTVRATQSQLISGASDKPMGSRTLPAPASYSSTATQPAQLETSRSLESGDALDEASNNVFALSSGKSFMVMNATNVPQPHNRVISTIPQSAGQRELSTSRSLPQRSIATGRMRQTEAPRNDYDGESDDEDEDELLRHLERCADAVANLSSKLEEVTHRWQSRRRYEKHGLTADFQATHKAMKKLWTFEVDFEPLEETDGASSDDSTTRATGIRSDQRFHRRRAGSSTSRTTSTPRRSRLRGRKLAEAALEAGVGALAVESISRFRGRRRRSSSQRSRSRVRVGVPIATAGLGGAALAGLFEKNKARQEPEEGNSVPLETLSFSPHGPGRPHGETANETADPGNAVEDDWTFEHTEDSATEKNDNAERWEPEEKERRINPMSGMCITKEGEVRDENGDLIGKLSDIQSDLSHCVGQEIDDAGNVIDVNGNKIGEVNLLENIADDFEGPTEEELEETRKREQGPADIEQYESCRSESSGAEQPLLLPGQVDAGIGEAPTPHEVESRHSSASEGPLIPGPLMPRISFGPDNEMRDTEDYLNDDLELTQFFKPGLFDMQNKVVDQTSDRDNGASNSETQLPPESISEDALIGVKSPYGFSRLRSSDLKDLPSEVSRPHPRQIDRRHEPMLNNQVQTKSDELFKTPNLAHYHDPMLCDSSSDEEDVDVAMKMPVPRSGAFGEVQSVRNMPKEDFSAVDELLREWTMLDVV